MKTVLIVDENLGFVFWLGQLLQSAGFAAFPARRVYDAGIVILDHALTVDILIVNPFLPGAADLIARLRQNQKHLKVITIAEPGLAGGPGVDTSCPKPRHIDEEARLEWLSVVRHVLSEVFP